MIIGTKSINLYVIHLAPDINIDGTWINSEILKCMEILEKAFFVKLELYVKILQETLLHTISAEKDGKDSRQQSFVPRR